MCLIKYDFSSGQKLYITLMFIIIINNLPLAKCTSTKNPRLLALSSKIEFNWIEFICHIIITYSHTKLWKYIVARWPQKKSRIKSPHYSWFHETLATPVARLVGNEIIKLIGKRPTKFESFASNYRNSLWNSEPSSQIANDFDGKF